MIRLATPLLALAILLLNLWFAAPLFMSGELPFRGSIEGGYVGMARFLAAHPNPWGWNPLPYAGLPTQFLYVPAVPYLAALGIHLWPHVPAGDVYRCLVAAFACFGPVAVFFFALSFTRSRRWAFAIALAYTFLSPSYGLFPAVEKDRGVTQLPWRIQVLAKYGEGPHIAALSLLPVALLGLWTAATRRSYWRILAAALPLALIPLTNWLAAFALALAAALLLLAAWGEPDFQPLRALAAAAIAYLLACFWLTPTFVQTIAFNWPSDSFGYQLRDRQLTMLAGLALGIIVLRVAFRLLRGSFYFCFVTLAAFAFGWIATGFYLYGVDTIPESRRYAVEFELFLILALAEAVRLALRSTNPTVRLCAMGAGGMLLLAGTPQLWAYASQGWAPWKPSPPQSTVEYQLARWIADHPPQGRVFVTGGLRFRLDSWFDIPQIGGSFETGLQNRLPVDLAYRIRTAYRLRPGQEAEDTLLELKALGARYVVVHGPKSREYYRDFARPERIASLPVAFRLEDDTIYELPDRPLAHLVGPADLPASDVRGHSERLAGYVAAIEDPARPRLDVRWPDPSRVTITGPVPAGQRIDLQVNHDPGWRATQDGRPLAIGRDPLGFILLEPAPAAATTIDLHYRGTAEQRVMAAISALAWIAWFAALLFTFRRERRPSKS